MNSESPCTIKALVKLRDGRGDSLALKRLALLFDEILYLPPHLPPVIKETVKAGTEANTIDSASFAKRLPDGSIDLSCFNYFRDTERFFVLCPESLEPELVDTLGVFDESGITRQPSQTEWRQFLEFKNEDFDRICDTIASKDVRDENFNLLSGTSASDYELFNHLRVITISDSNGNKCTFTCINTPNSITDSYDLTTLLAMAHEISAYPVFLDPRHKKELEYRYEQLLDSQRDLGRQYPELVNSLGLPGRFGEVAYSISNVVFDANVIIERSAEEIVKYRTALRDARRRYLTGDLLELAQIVESNPWGEKTREEIRRYVNGRLNQDIQKYDDQSRQVWEKLFGGLIVEVAEIAKSAAVGGSAGGLLGSIIPNVSSWELVMIGAITGLATEAPKLVKAIVESVLEARKLKRSSTAYVTRFKR